MCGFLKSELESRNSDYPTQKPDDGLLRIQSLVDGCITCTDEFTGLDTVVGFEKPKEDISSSLILPFEVPTAFDKGRKENNMFLLYGLPATRCFVCSVMK
jgi:hypothetical protein